MVEIKQKSEPNWMRTSDPTYSGSTPVRPIFYLIISCSCEPSGCWFNSYRHTFCAYFFRTYDPMYSGSISDWMDPYALFQSEI